MGNHSTELGSYAGPTIEFANEHLRLLPQRAIWWQRTRTLLLADTHFGKAAAFRQSGIPVPAGTTQSMLDRISQLVEAFHVQTLMVLGDFVHSSHVAVDDFCAELAAWRATTPKLEITLVQGNHDQWPREFWRQLSIDVVQEPFQVGPFSMCHRSGELLNSARMRRAPRSGIIRQGISGQLLPDMPIIAGHVHPGVRMASAAGDSVRLPCFLQRGSQLILPAFGQFTGMQTVRPLEKDRVFVVISGQVREISPFLVAKRQVLPSNISLGNPQT